MLKVHNTITDSSNRDGISSNSWKITNQDVKALVFEFDHPHEPQLKVFTSTNTYHLSAAVRQIPQASRVIRDELEHTGSSVSSFQDRVMYAREPSNVDTTDALSMEDISDVTLTEQNPVVHQLPVKSYQQAMPALRAFSPITSRDGPPIVELPVIEDRRVRNRHYSFISVKVRQGSTIGTVLLRSFRLTHQYMPIQISCSICEGIYKSGDTVIALPCTHLFHKSCVLLHLSQKSSLCPLCGADVTKPDHPVFSDRSISSGSDSMDFRSDAGRALCSI